MDASAEDTQTRFSLLDFGPKPSEDAQWNIDSNASSQQLGFGGSSQSTYGEKISKSLSSKRIAKKAHQLEPAAKSLNIHNFEDAPEDEQIGVGGQLSFMSAAPIAQSPMNQQHPPPELKRAPFSSDSLHQNVSPCPSPPATTTSSVGEHHCYGGAGAGVRLIPTQGNNNAQTPALSQPPVNPPNDIIGSHATISPLTSPSRRSNNPNEPPQAGTRSNTNSFELSGVPAKASGNPKTELQHRYDGAGKINGKCVKLQIPKKNFVSWNNGKECHAILWSCIFVCPVTRECFLAGELMSLEDDNDVGNRYQYDDNIRAHLYGKAQKAREAAAGRAEDCFRIRENTSSGSGVRYQFCIETPYMETSAVMEPELIPPEILQKIRGLQN